MRHKSHKKLEWVQISDEHQPLPWRNWLRENMPHGRAGFVYEDLDLISLTFGSTIGRNYNEDGKFMLIEIKQKSAKMAYAQRRVFGLIHRLLRKGDPSKDYYIGFYLVHWYDDCVKVNGKRLNFSEFKAFLENKLQIQSLFDSI